jgi:preprotein translocase subunit YajC
MREARQLAWAIALAIAAYASDAAVSALHGTVTKVDHASKTIVVKTADGTEHTVKVAAKTSVHGTKEGFDGLKEGTEVAVHSTGKGAEETAVEVDKLGTDGLKATEGTITKVDKDAKTATVKTADGTEETFKMTDHAADDVGKAVGKGTEETAKGTVYYTEEAGKKVVHFFER